MSMDINLNATLDTKNFGRPLGKISGDVKDFSASLAASNARVLAFGASTAVLGGVAKAFKDVANATIEVEKALIDINRIAQKSQSEMTGLSAAIFDLAKEATISFKDASKATLEFARQGLSAEKALLRTKDALILTRLTGISTARSVESLTAVVNGFSEAGLTTSAVLAKLVAVEQNFAVSANDLIQAFSRTGQAAQSAGVDIDELSALVTLAQERTARGGAVIGNALKTIFTRLGRSDTLDSLESYGILVKDASRQTLPATQILKNFAGAYKSLDAAAKSSLTEQVAGVFQVNILKAILGGVNESYQTYEKSLARSKAATNEATLANEALNKSLSAIIDQTGIDLERLLANIGQISFAPMAGTIVGAFDSVFETLNKGLEKEGGGIAKGFLAGFTNILTGPGLFVAILALGKTMITAFSFAAKSLPILIGISTETQKRRNLEASIVEIMQRDSVLSRQLADSTLTRLQKEELLTNAVRETTLALRNQIEVSKQLVMSPSLRGSVVSTPAGLKHTGKAEGYIPHFRQEEKLARSLGAINPIAKFGKGTIGGEKFIMNNREVEIPRFGSNGDSAVIPMYAKGKGVDKFSGMGLPGTMQEGYQIRQLAKKEMAKDRGESLKQFNEALGRSKFKMQEELKVRSENLKLERKALAQKALLEQAEAKRLEAAEALAIADKERAKQAKKIRKENEKHSQAFEKIDQQDSAKKAKAQKKAVRTQVEAQQRADDRLAKETAAKQKKIDSEFEKAARARKKQDDIRASQQFEAARQKTADETAAAERRKAGPLKRGYRGVLDAGQGRVGLAMQIGLPMAAGAVSQAFEPESKGANATNAFGQGAGIGGLIGSVLPFGPIIGAVSGGLIAMTGSLILASTASAKLGKRLEEQNETLAKSSSFGQSYIDSVLGIKKLKEEGADNSTIMRAEAEKLKIATSLQGANEGLYKALVKAGSSATDLSKALSSIVDAEKRKVAQLSLMKKNGGSKKEEGAALLAEAFGPEAIDILSGASAPKFRRQRVASAMSGAFGAGAGGGGETYKTVLTEESRQEIRRRAVQAAVTTSYRDEDFTRLVNVLIKMLSEGVGTVLKTIKDDATDLNPLGEASPVPAIKKMNLAWGDRISADILRRGNISEMDQQIFNFDKSFNELITNRFVAAEEEFRNQKKQAGDASSRKESEIIKKFSDSNSSLISLLEGRGAAPIKTALSTYDFGPLKKALEATAGPEALDELKKILEIEKEIKEVYEAEDGLMDRMHLKRQQSFKLSQRELDRFDEFNRSLSDSGVTERRRGRRSATLSLDNMDLEQQLSDPQSFLGKGMIAKAQAQNAIQSKISQNNLEESLSGKYSSAEGILKSFRTSEFQRTGVQTQDVGQFSDLEDVRQAIKELESFDMLRVEASGADKDRLEKIKQLKKVESEISLDIAARSEKQKRDAQRALSEARRLTSFRGGYNDSMQEMKNSVDTFEYTLGNKIPTLFRDGMVDAIQTAMNESDNLGDALSGIARTFLLEIQRAFIGQAVNSVVSGFGNFGNVKTSQKGGIIQAQNGMFLGGNRTGDRNPALLEDGEYVLNRNAVKGLGGPSEIDKLNFGAFPRFANGGSYSGSLSVPLDKLSGFGRENSPEYNEFLDSEREKFQKSLAKKAATRALLVSLLSTAVSAGVSYGMSSYANRSKPPAGTINRGSSMKAPIPGIPDFYGEQSGGFIASGSRLRDSVPAFLAGGEFVVNSRAVRKYGVGGLNRINSGVRGFQDGGLVGGGGEVANPSNNIDSSKTNDVTINITINNSSKGSSQEQSQSGTGDKDPSMLLAAKVKESVYQIIMTEQRSGGLLESTRRQ
jgi:TP901 family phage tail tape measure protein